MTIQQRNNAFAKKMENKMKNHKQINKMTLEQKLELAQNPNTNPEDLSLLSKDEYWEVRTTVALHPNTNPEDLRQLSNDEDLDVRIAVAKNPNTLPKTLHFLSEDKNWLVREAVAANHNTKFETLYKLSKNDHADVCYAANKSIYQSFFKREKKECKNCKQNKNDTIVHQLHDDVEVYIINTKAPTSENQSVLRLSKIKSFSETTTGVEDTKTLTVVHSNDTVLSITDPVKYKLKVIKSENYIIHPENANQIVQIEIFL